MTSPDAPPSSRRALRAQAGERARTDSGVIVQPLPAAPVPAASLEAPAPDPSVLPEPDAATAFDAPADGRRVALAWVDPDTLGARRAPADLTAAASPYVPVLPTLLPRRRSAAPALVVVAIVLALVGGYVAATQLWSLDAVAPNVSASEAPSLAAPASSADWPAQGAAAVGVEGMDAASASSPGADAMASITKLIAVLMVQSEDPLAPGDAGPIHDVVYADRADYWGFLARGESALDVPLGGTLTRYQLMQGALIASAGNYVDLLTRDFWPTDEAFAAAARTWLDEKGLRGISVVEPTGIDRRNTADAASLVALGSLAMDDPVVAEIVGTRSAEIAGVGTFENTNPLLGDDDVVGIKTGGLIGHYNLLAAREVTVGEKTAYVYAAVIGQPTEALRASETAALLDAVAAEATAPQTLPAGTVVGTVTTAWGTTADVTTSADAELHLWNGARAEADVTLDIGETRDAGGTVGQLSLTGPLDDATVEVALTGDLGEPDAWWRLTHPLELFGLVG